MAKDTGILSSLNETMSAPVRPDPDYRYNNNDYDVDRKRLSFLVGLAAISMPLLIGATIVFGDVHFRDSISHYYYSVFLGDYFIVTLAFIGTFLIVYKGESDMETFLATLAGICCFGVALFPTSGSGVELGIDVNGRIFVPLGAMPASGELPVRSPGLLLENAFSLFSYAGVLHYASAAGLFAFLVYYCFFVFTRFKPEHFTDDGKVKPLKSVRNTAYRFAGTIILICIAMMASKSLFKPTWDNVNATFIFEAFALVIFGATWLIKSKLFGYLED